MKTARVALTCLKDLVTGENVNVNFDGFQGTPACIERLTWSSQDNSVPVQSTTHTTIPFS